MQKAKPHEGEDGIAYLDRLLKELEALKQDYGKDGEDRDGGATGAVTDVIMMVTRLMNELRGI